MLPPTGDDSKKALAMFPEQEEEVKEEGLHIVRNNEPGELLRHLR